MNRTAKRKMAHHRLIFYETPEGRIHILSHEKRKGYVPLKIADNKVEMTAKQTGEGPNQM